MEASEDDKLNLLIRRMDLSAYEFIDTATSYTEAIDKLQKVYDKKVYIIYGRWKLSNEKQQETESMETFQLKLMIISKDCGLSDVTAVE